MKRLLLFCFGLVLLLAAGLCRYGLAPHFTQRVPPGWRWNATFIGSQAVPDEKTGRFPERDSINSYERELKVVDESGRPHKIVIKNRYTTFDLASAKITWEYITMEHVDPQTGARLEAEFQGDWALFPRNTQKETYSLRSNYLRGVPVRFEREESVEGLPTYLFSYKGPAEYTESYAGSPQYPGVAVKPGQEIRCADDQFSIRLWVEPITGEIVKVDERAPSGDWIHDVATGQKLTPVMRWGGSTAGDDVVRRVAAVRSERNRLLWAQHYGPGLLAAGGLAALAASWALRLRQRHPTGNLTLHP